MKTIVNIFSIMILLTNLGFAQSSIGLKGKLVDDQESPTPFAGVTVWANGKYECLTSKSGEFSFEVPVEGVSRKLSGYQAILTHSKNGWIMQYPLDGKWNLPKLSELHEVKAVLLPMGSKKLWTHERIEAYLADLQTSLAAARNFDEERLYGQDNVDFMKNFKKWGDRLGFTPGEITERFDSWAEEIANTKSIKKRAMREYYLKNFEAAAKLYRKSAEINERKGLKFLHQSGIEYWLSGESLFLAGQHDSAKIDLQKALKYTDQNLFPEEWANVQLSLGTINTAIALKAEGDSCLTGLNEAIAHFEKALTIYTYEQMSTKWGFVQNSLGIAWRNIGVRIKGHAVFEKLNASEGACRNALKVISRDEFPHAWALAQGNLGKVLRDIGIRLKSETGLKKLIDAEIAYRRALDIWDRSEFPEKWAGAQSNLGVILSEIGSRFSGQGAQEKFKQSEQAFRKALELINPDKNPEKWATFQLNRGVVLRIIGNHTEGQSSLDTLFASERVIRSVQNIYSRQEYPQEWAMTQNNLGIVLWEIGKRIEGQDGLEKLLASEKAHRDALSVYTFGDLPQNWAMTQNNLGNVLVAIGLRLEDQARIPKFEAAETAFLNSLKVYTEGDFPYDWLFAHGNLVPLYFLMERFEDACHSLEFLKEGNPVEVTGVLSLIYQNMLFEFEKSYEENRTLVNELGYEKAIPNWVEAHLTTERFKEGAKLVKEYQSSEDRVNSDSTIALDILALAFDVLQGLNARETEEKTEALVLKIQDQEPGYNLDYTFDGTIHYLADKSNKVRHRKWLVTYFKALQGKSRDEIVSKLKALR